MVKFIMAVNYMGANIGLSQLARAREISTKRLGKIALFKTVV